MKDVSIIIPVVRPKSAKRCIDAIIEHTGLDNVEVKSMRDTEKIGCPHMVKKLTGMAKYDLVMFLGDDTIPEAGFLEAAVAEMEKLPDGWGVVGLNTEDPRGSNKKAHWLAHKEMLKHIDGGAFMPTDYKHCFGDDELFDIANEMNRWSFAEDSRIKHDHPVNKGGRDYDEFHTRAYGNGKFEEDRKTYFKRKIERNRKKYGKRLGIAFPLTNTMIPANFVYSFLAMDKPNFDFFLPEHEGKMDAVRNDIVSQALNTGVTHLWMTDTDQIYFDTDTLNKMLNHNAPIVSIPVMRRYPPFDPMLWRLNDKAESVEVPFDEIKDAFDNGKTLDINVTGAGSILFDMDIFTEIDFPWFKMPDYGENGCGEDIYFWRKAFSKGYNILADCSINVEHLTRMGVGFKTHKAFRIINHMGEQQNGK